MPLTVKKVQAFREPGRYGDGRGLYLQVQGETNRCWVFRYQLRGRKRMFGLGSAADVTLEEAREAARLARLLLRAGKDPIDEAAAQRRAKEAEAAKALTFEECATQWYRQHENRWRNAKVRASIWSQLRRYVLPLVGKLPVAAVRFRHFTGHGAAGR